MLPALKILEEDEDVPVGYQLIELMTAFDVKMNLTLKKEFGEYTRKKAILVKAVYGLKSLGFTWKSLCTDVLKEQLEFQPCRRDINVWHHPCKRKDGLKYYEYILVYTDDVITISENPKAIMDKLNNFFVLKPDSIKEPTTYLGATIWKHKLDGDDYFTWAIGSEAYLQESLRSKLRQCN
ncbi:unnamed protein product [Cylindrotheca closterium]|uniref:Reverse transcriptase Ty1/copia-type domain-containing protein n=1 Tax=Cylindrotheca closterium TaxID=2856 RepID=A0AAD2CDZ8_9STRA|nr:unnamed protein product [Cylindrotheca closterium]